MGNDKCSCHYCLVHTLFIVEELLNADCAVEDIAFEIDIADDEYEAEPG